MVNSAQYASASRNVLVRSAFPKGACEGAGALSVGATLTIADDVARAAHRVNKGLVEALVDGLP